MNSKNTNRITRNFKKDDQIVSNKALGPSATVDENTINENRINIFENGFDVQQTSPSELGLTNEIKEIDTHERCFDIHRLDYVSNSPLVRNNRSSGVLPESVIGTDDRIQVYKTNSSPWVMICQLVVTDKDGIISLGTGWFISPRTIMTAGHCVYNHNGNPGWAKSIEVIPGMNRHFSPFGSVIGTLFQSVRGWTMNKRRTHDYGCIILPKSSPMGNRTGWFGFARLSDNSLQNLLVNNSGYPGDKPYGTQWFNADRLKKASSKQLRYSLDTAGGQSGSPIWRLSIDKRHAVGIHAYGGAQNKSTRIDAAVFNNMLMWKRLGR